MEQKIKKDIEAVFGVELTAQQLWALVKLSKRVRKYCRSNTAFNNAFSRIFPYAQFREVTKTRLDGSSYPGLQITVKGEVYDKGEDET
jgi:hypothetical protein